MKTLRLLLFVVPLLAVAVGLLATVDAAALPRMSPMTARPSMPDADEHKAHNVVPRGPSIGPDHLIHPCGGMAAEPSFTGLSPLAIAYTPASCSGDDYGDIAVWQAGGHDYVALSGFYAGMFSIWNVDDPYNPQLLVTQPHPPPEGTAGTSVFAFKQGGNRYLSVTERAHPSSTSCGFFVYNVNNPASPVFVNRKAGAPGDWCTVHEHFVSHDSNGDADYAWLAMSGEFGSGDKIVVLDLSDISNPQETGRYERPDGAGFIHDSNVVGNRAYLAHWDGGVLIHDKATLANNINPASINPVNSIRPAGFAVHHMAPTTDGKFLFIEDEFLNASNAEKIKYYNITNSAAPFYVGGIIGSGIAATSQAHNLVIKPLSPGHDLLMAAWYRAGTRIFEIDTTGAAPVITETAAHQLSQTAGPGFGNVWGVDWLPCTLHGQPYTCIYSGDMTYGLVVDALGYHPSLDPYAPEAQITNPTPGQNITTCIYTVQGIAHDYYSGLSQIEVSTDNGANWSPAQGTTNWSYQWNITANGSYQLKVRGRDVAGNIQTPSGAVAVNATGNCAPATATPTPTVTRQLVGHVVWQGRPPQPHASQQLPLTLTLKLGGTEVNYPAATTDSNGRFTVTLGSLPTGTYSWRVKGPHGIASANTGPGYLANAGSVALSGVAVTQHEIGTLRSGDANNDDLVDIADFNALVISFGRSSGDPGYDARADFDGDGIVDVSDFNQLKSNFGTGGSPPIRPQDP